MSYKIGVDGGGTKTECILTDGAGSVLASYTGAGCNPSLVGLERAAELLQGALNQLRAQAGLRAGNRGESSAPLPPLISHTLMSMAGHRDFWRDLAKRLTGFGQVATMDDSFPVLELATEGQPGLVLHAGTGSFVTARAPDGSTHYSGGLGWRFGDSGSGYDLGRRGIARGLMEIQGWLPPSGLGPAVRTHSGLLQETDAGVITRSFYQHADPNRQIAAFAPVVLGLAGAGDAAARDLAVASTGDLLDQALHLAAKLFPAESHATLTAGLSGPILNHPVVRSELQRRAPFAFKAITEAPIEGVRRMLARL